MVIKEPDITIDGKRPGTFQELIGFIDDAWAYAEAQTIPLEETDVPLRLLYGINIQAIRHSVAFVTLHRAGLVPEGNVSVRAALEHAVTSQWCYYTTGGIDRLGESVEAGMIEYYGAVSKWLDDEKLAAKVEALKAKREQRRQEERVAKRPRQKQLPTFTGPDGILGGIDPDVMLNMSYKVLSLATHVTHSTTVGYLQHLPESAWQFSTKPDTKFEWPSAYSAATAAMFASWVQAILTRDDARQAQLNALSNKLLVPLSLEDAIDPRWMLRKAP